MSIKPLAPRVCPSCGQEGAFAILENKIECRICGYVVRDESGKPTPLPNNDPKPEFQPEQPLQPSYRKTHIGPVDPWAESAFYTGQDYIRQKNWEEAAKAFQRAIEMQSDYVDAHLWLSRILTHPEQKRDHLTTILANQPNHLEAVRELMILDGKLTPEAANMNEYQESTLRSAGGAVGTETQNLRCPTCGSQGLSQDEMTGLIVCESCGHTMQSNQRAGEGNLTMALLERRAKPIRWIIGERLLACNSCGAERTIPAKKLSDRCPFCDSTHVIERDVLESFQQPDGIIPFAIKRKQAEEKIEERLGGWMERMKGWFINNTVERMEVTGAYLPFWMFDAVVDVRKTTTRRVESERSQRYTSTTLPAYQTVNFPDAMNNVPIPAVKSPPRRMTAKLDKYEMSKMVAYEPKMLARYPAELYSIDFDKASLDARSVISKHMREKHSITTDNSTEVRVSAGVQSMSFQLVLMPVWVATIHEQDGDIRTVLVNGQTGTVVLGKAHKPKD